MRYLYLDNFRGFKDATVPILDVNFLVGENSTGKTSVLSMLKMLSNPSLLLGAQIIGLERATDGVLFSHFSEMVSAHSSDKNYFRLGMIGPSRSITKKSTTVDIEGILITFREFDGLPSFSQITYASGRQALNLRIETDHISYKFLDIPSIKDPVKTGDRLREWAEQHADSSKDGWTNIASPKGHDARQWPLFVMLTLAISGDSKKSAEFNTIAPLLGSELVWIAPIRAKPLRTYDEPHTPFSPDGTHTPYVIRRMLETASSAAKFRKFIDKIGNESGLFEKIDIKYFNTEKIGPFEVDAFIDGEALSLGWLGYGVSQSLPIMVELIFRSRKSCFAIQQPEVHLHPRAQASLGDAFFEMALLDRKTFLVETHSDFTIDRFRMNYRTKRSAKARSELPSSQVLFFERRDKQNTVTPISIDETGQLSSDQPDSYRDFFIREDMRLIGSK